MHCCSHVFLGGFVLLALLGNAAAAQPATESADDPTAEQGGGPYWEAVHLAIQEYRTGNWAEARIAFARAHELRPSARTHRGLGLTAYELRDYVAAVDAFELALAEERAPLPVAQREEIAGLLPRARSYVGEVKLELSPAGTAVALDGRAVALRDGGVVRLNIGKHQLSFSAPDHRSAVRDVEVRGAETLPVRVTLESLRPAPTIVRAIPMPLERPAPAAVTVAPTSPALADSEPSASRAWTWIALGTGVAFAGAASALWLEGNDRLDGIAADCRPAGCTRAERAAAVEQENLPTYEALTTVSLALSVTALVGGAVLYFIEGAAPAAQRDGQGDGERGDASGGGAGSGVRVHLSPGFAAVGWSL